MKKIIFACDLDNTLIHSYRKKADNDICVEILNDKEQSFVTPSAYRLIQNIAENDNVLLLPVTTRSVEQYKRIKWPDSCVPELALVCNGSVLLKNGEYEHEWYEYSKKVTAPYSDELKRLSEKYSTYNCFKTVRIVDDMFLFTYCYEKDAIEQIAAECSKDTELSAEYSGSKLYFFPPAANKGTAVKRFLQLYGADKIIAAGDSLIDCSMLNVVDTALVPDISIAEHINIPQCFICNENEVFSEFILKFVEDNSQ